VTVKTWNPASSNRRRRFAGCCSRWAVLGTAATASVPSARATEEGPPAHSAVAAVPTETSPHSARIPLDRDFSAFELVTIGGVTASALVLATAGSRILGQPSPSFGAPAQNSFDRTWADRLHFDAGHGHWFLGRVPDLTGQYVLPFLPAVAYGIDAVAYHRGSGAILSDDLNADHRLFAFAEALGWTTLLTNVTKFIVGRERPYAVLHHPELAGPARESNLSFFSGHASAMFAAASFVSLDVGRRLTSGPLAATTAEERWLLGTLAPYSCFFGTAALVALSRVIDQQHWPTDVLAGAVVGTAVARLSYGAHFDVNGTPRMRHPVDGDTDIHLVPTRRGLSVTGAWQ
jgi:membrane-associated phospholipid phosphatase